MTNGTHSLAAANVVNMGPNLNMSGGSLDFGALTRKVTSFNRCLNSLKLIERQH